MKKQSNVIHVPFQIDYGSISSFIAAMGVDAARKELLEQGHNETVVSVLIKRSLSKGWGS